MRGRAKFRFEFGFYYTNDRVGEESTVHDHCGDANAAIEWAKRFAQSANVVTYVYDRRTRRTYWFDRGGNFRPAKPE